MMEEQQCHINLVMEELFASGEARVIHAQKVRAKLIYTSLRRGHSLF